MAGRILESDACSQNKVFRTAANVGYKYPTYGFQTAFIYLINNACF
jgi:hypothetical protein